ncbi:hypothetical protein ACE6H2_015419 [Prunus campanulata]
MAPQITVYFHDLPTTIDKDGRANPVVYQVSLIVDRAPVSLNVQQPNHGVKANKPAIKVTKTQLNRTLSKNSIKDAKERVARALSRKTCTDISREVAIEDIPLVAAKATSTSHRVIKTTSYTASKACISAQIMIGSIPITLTTKEHVMVTSVRECDIPTKQKAQISWQTTTILPQLAKEDITIANLKSQGRDQDNTSHLWGQSRMIAFDKSKKAKQKNGRFIRPKVRSQIHISQGADLESLAKLNKQVMRLKDSLSQGAPLKPQVMSKIYNAPTTQDKAVASTDAFQGLNKNKEIESMSVMVIGTSSLEEQIQEMQKKLAEKDAEIASLTTQLATKVNIDGGQLEEKRGSSSEQLKEMKDCSSYITHQEIKTLIAEGIREFQMSLTPPVLGYQKPYPAHYDALPFPKGYQRPKFEKFDGINGSPQEHLAHFHSACGETSQSDALLIRQFVQSLKESAFTWYTELLPGSILTWDDLQKAFLAQFVCSKKKISLTDLSNASQNPNECVNEFISRWRSLNLQCTEKLTEKSAVQMCSSNLLPEIATFVSTVEPETFDALVSVSDNIERQVTRKKSFTQTVHFEIKGTDNDEEEEEESMATFAKCNKKFKNGKGKERPRKFTYKERKEVKYTFDIDDVEQILTELLMVNAIKLPKPKRPYEVDKTSDFNYCRYHRSLGHRTKDCHTFKDIIQGMIDNEQIQVDSQ